MSDQQLVPHLMRDENHSGTSSETASWLTHSTSQSSIDSETVDQRNLDSTTERLSQEHGDQTTTEKEQSQDGRGTSCCTRKLRRSRYAEQSTNIIDIRGDVSQFSLAKAIRRGLRAAEPSLPAMTLWDSKGLELFEKASQTEDYYLGRVELEILERRAGDIAQRISNGSMIVDLGCGNAQKIRFVLQRLEELGRNIEYYALDLSQSEIERSLDTLSNSCSLSWRFVHCHGLLETFNDAQRWLQESENQRKPKCLVSLGSSLGNEPGPEAINFLAGFADVLRRSEAGSLSRDEIDRHGSRKPSLFIIGLDPTKDVERIRRAYADSAGLNVEFILNALNNANTVLGYEAFRSADWTVIGEWNDDCWKQNLVPKIDVMFEGICVRAGEKVPVVQSRKYDADQKHKLWKAAGLKELRSWSCTDESVGEQSHISLIPCTHRFARWVKSFFQGHRLT
ncbi:MAG: hypothetical protein Q9164_002450 [Protoblastenia rupestris]